MIPPFRHKMVPPTFKFTKTHITKIRKQIQLPKEFNQNIERERLADAFAVLAKRAEREFDGLFDGVEREDGAVFLVDEERGPSGQTGDAML